MKLTVGSGLRLADHYNVEDATRSLLLRWAGNDEKGICLVTSIALQQLDRYRAFCSRFHMGTTQAGIVVALALLLSLVLSPTERYVIGLPFLVYTNAAILYFYSSGAIDLIRQKRPVILGVYSLAYSFAAGLMDSFIASYFFV